MTLNEILSYGNITSIYKDQLHHLKDNGLDVYKSTANRLELMLAEFGIMHHHSNEDLEDMVKYTFGV